MTPPGARGWIALGHKDMRKGMQGLALLVQQGLKRNPNGGDLFVFRGRAGSLFKIIWNDRIDRPPYAKRLEKGRTAWPSASDGTVSLTPRSWPAYWRELTGVTRNVLGCRRAPDNRRKTRILSLQRGIARD
jgi:transposase